MEFWRKDKVSNCGIWRNAALTIDFIRLSSNTRCVSEYSPIKNENKTWFVGLTRPLSVISLILIVFQLIPSKFWSMTFVSLLWLRLSVLSPLRPHIVRRPIFGIFEWVIVNVFKRRNCCNKEMNILDVSSRHFYIKLLHIFEIYTAFYSYLIDRP